MELARMATGIIKIIDKEYDQHVDDECLDIIQIKNICNLYKTKNNSVNSISLSEISFSSPEFKKVANKIDKKNQAGVLKSEEFVKKYSFFIKNLYACLKMGITIFDINDNILTL